VEAHGNPYLKESNIFMEPTLIDALCRSDDFVILTASLKLKAVFSFFFFYIFSFILHALKTHQILHCTAA